LTEFFYQLTEFLFLLGMRIDGFLPTDLLFLLIRFWPPIGPLR